MDTVTDSVVSPDGTRIVYHVQGQGVPLVIVHGSIATTDMYRGIADLLAPHYRVVLMERREYGPSGTGPRPCDFTRQAADLAAVLDAMGEPAFVFGHSFGGLVALHAMSDSPAVPRLALYEPSVALAGPVLARVQTKARELVAAGREQDALLEFFTARADPPPPADQLRWVAEQFAFRVPGMMADLECITSMDTDLTRWSTLDTPILLLTGENTDPLSKQSIARIQQILPNARTTTLPGQAHHPENPRLVADALREFFG
ncbi:alpha/beta hydrolase [Nocardia terpenica]|uniref:alpha/beta fold hydrolase n=1 Tax=Nocardia terpenica TaxID=455432 RepID=UPI0018954CF8|nr:alpha/beta hydrolase [Nocardia terpenica]MBF6059210.1 alpha/beta hydrolase [Nocardia terpenica]MBF6103251.1 alpha/beta hydrolase [Nocardia terpenica]MBF6110560.1 alpha/beta hydrolase [Nocardia terpenica]MBF6116691.1 alpha/beta hydrolase [Nocardia terpenica]